MLSRIAESLFWIGRYIERSDGTARILDVHLQLLLEDPWIEEDLACRSLLSVMGSDVPEDRVLNRQSVLEILAVDRSEPASIAYSLGAARENARRAREIVSSELWECLNTTRARMPRKIATDKVHEFFGWVRERSALAVGIIESATSRDEAWQFFTLGRSIERADMTARLLATRSLTEASGPSWTTILRSCGAYEAYLRTSRGVPSARNAAEFVPGIGNYTYDMASDAFLRKGKPDTPENRAIAADYIKGALRQSDARVASISRSSAPSIHHSAIDSPGCWRP